MTGKFYGINKNHEVSEKYVFYTNLNMFVPIETSIGSLECINLNLGGISTCLFTLKGFVWDNDHVLNHPEAAYQFKLLVGFFFKVIIDDDKYTVEDICRNNVEGLNEYIVQSKIIPQFFSDELINEDLINEFKCFIDKVLGLPRYKYKSVINSIDTFFQSIELVKYNLELAFSLMVYSLESLSKYLDFNPSWENYDEIIRFKLDSLFDDEEIDENITEKIKSILIKHSHSKAKANFIEFSMNHIKDSYFKEEAHNIDGPLKKSDVKRALINTYNIRSNYVHRLSEMDNFKKYLNSMSSKEILYNNGNVYLTYSALTRLVHHIIHNFICSCETLNNENIRWDLELPNRMRVGLHYSTWISDSSSFKEDEIFYFYSNFLSLLCDYFEGKVPFYNLKDLMFKIQKLLKKGVKKEFRGPMVCFYFLYNSLAPDTCKIENFNEFLENNNLDMFLNNLTIENFVISLIIPKECNWALEDIVLIYNYYENHKHNKFIVKLPEYFEICSLLFIAYNYSKIEDFDNFELWVNKAILDLPHKQNCQNFLEEKLNADDDLDLIEFSEYYFNNEDFS